MRRAPARAARWPLLLAVALAGCTSSREAMRDAAMRSVLESAVLPGTLAEVRAHMESLPRASWSPGVEPCDGCLEAALCRGPSCGFWLRYAEEEVRLEASDVGTGVQVRFLSGSNAAAHRVGVGLWHAVDPNSLEVQSQRIEAAVLRGDAPESVGFSARTAPGMALFMSAGSQHIGGALRVGLHRWHGPNLLTGYALEYQGGILGFLTTRPRAGHFLSPTFLVEWSRWTEQTDRAWGTPGLMGYVLAAPVFFVGDGPVSFGWKVGLGVGTEPSLSPFVGRLFIELTYQRFHTPNVGALGSLGGAVGYGF